MGYIEDMGKMAALAALAVVMGAACSAAGGGESTNEITYWVELKLAPEIKVKYTVRRVFILGPGGEKVGNSLGPFNGRFKVILPAKYAGTAQRFSVEFSRETSFLDDLLKDESYQTALAILKSFHYSTSPDPDDLVPLPEDRSQVIVLPQDPGAVIDENNISMGYSEQSKDILANMPNIPPMFPVAFHPGANMQYYADNGYRANVGFVTHITDELQLGSGQSIDPTKYLGFAGGDDWYLILQSKALKEGDPLRMWILYTHESKSPRLYYQNIVLPALFSVITVQPSFAGLPIDRSLFQLLAIGALPIADKESESYTFVSREYNAGALPPPFATSVWPISSSIFNGIFKGEIHGGGFKVTGLKLDATQPNNGFVRELTDRSVSTYTFAGVIDDLVLQIASVSGLGGANLGGVAGYVHGSALISNINVTGTQLLMLDGKAANAGGIAGKVPGADLDVTVNITNTTQNVASFDIGEPATIFPPSAP
jgi:hypothetical protein